MRQKWLLIYYCRQLITNIKIRYILNIINFKDCYYYTNEYDNKLQDI